MNNPLILNSQGSPPDSPPQNNSCRSSSFLTSTMTAAGSERMSQDRILDPQQQPQATVTPPLLAHPFPVKLHALLESQRYESIISWQPDGKSFIVQNTQEFVRLILPTHFNQTKLKSFQRQLSFYNFKRISSGPYAGGYKHELFIRGYAHLCKNIMRTNIIKKNKTRKSLVATSAPPPPPPPLPDSSIIVASRNDLVSTTTTSSSAANIDLLSPSSSTISRLPFHTIAPTAVLNSKIPAMDKIDKLIHESIEKINVAIHQSINDFHASLQKITMESIFGSDSDRGIICNLSGDNSSSCSSSSSTTYTSEQHVSSNSWIPLPLNQYSMLKSYLDSADTLRTIQDLVRLIDDRDTEETRTDSNDEEKEMK